MELVYSSNFRDVTPLDIEIVTTLNGKLCLSSNGCGVMVYIRFLDPKNIYVMDKNFPHHVAKISSQHLPNCNGYLKSFTYYAVALHPTMLIFAAYLSNGDVEVWCMENKIYNDLKLTISLKQVLNEDKNDSILDMVWLAHISVSLEAAEHSVWSRLRTKKILSLFANRKYSSFDKCLVVFSKKGFLHVTVINGSSNLTAQTYISPAEDITLANICQNRHRIYVIYSNLMLRIFDYTLSLNDNLVELECNNSMSVVFKSAPMFMAITGDESLLICRSDNNQALLEVHSEFPGGQFKLLRSTYVDNVTSSSIVQLASNQFTSQHAECGLPAPLYAVMTRTKVLLYDDNLSLLTESYASNNEEEMSSCEFPLSMYFSHTSCSITILHPDILYLYKIPPKYLNTSISSVELVTGLFESTMRLGTDSWDLLLSVPPGSVETVIRLLSNRVSDQSRLICAVRSLFALTSSSQHEVIDCYIKLLLLNIHQLFCALPSPSSSDSWHHFRQVVASCDLGFSLKEFDDIKIEPKLQRSLNALSQWICELALNLLTVFPKSDALQSPTSCAKPILQLLCDANVLNQVRECLLLLKIWSYEETAVKPYIPSFGETDFVLKSYKYLTIITQYMHQTLNNDIINEIVHFTLQMRVPEISAPRPRGVIGCNNRHLLGSMYRVSLIPNSSNKVMDPSFRHDFMHCLYLGRDTNSDLKQCTRCGSVTLLKTSNMMPWEKCWSYSCFCGGLWKRIIRDW